MKKFIFVIFILAIGTTAYTQNIPEEQVPSPVKDNLYANFKAADVIWEMEDNMYEAEYLENGMQKTVVFNIEGTVIAVETQIDPSSLPQAIHDYIGEFYQGAEIREAEFVETKIVNTYKVELLYNGSIIELIFDEAGNFIRIDDSGRTDEDDN